MRKINKQNFPLLYLFIPLSFFVVLLIFSIKEDHLILSFSVLLFSFLTPFIIKKRKSVSLHDPIIVINGILFMLYFIAPLMDMYMCNYYYFGYDMRNYLPKGLFYFSLSVCAFNIGLVAYRNDNSHSSVLKGYKIKEYRKVTISLFLVIFILNLYYIYITKNTFLLNIISDGQYVAVQGHVLIKVISNGLIALIIIYYYHMGRIDRNVIVMSVLSLTIYIVLGARFRIIVLFLSMFILSSWQNGFSIKKLVAFLLIIFCLFGFIGALRYSIKNYKTINFNVDYNVDTGYEMYKGFLVVIDKYNKHQEYYLGKSLIHAFYSPIPSSVWPNKPKANIIDEVYSRSFDTDRPKYTGLAPLKIQETFINYGLGGIIIFSFAYGVFWRCFRRKAILKKENYQYVCIYVILLAYQVQYLSRGYMTQNYEEMLTILFPFVVLMIMDKIGLLKMEKKQWEKR